MSAYNIRKSKSVDHEPARGPRRWWDFARELGVLAVCLVIIYLVYLLVKRFL